MQLIFNSLQFPENSMYGNARFPMGERQFLCMETRISLYGNGSFSRGKLQFPMWVFSVTTRKHKSPFRINPISFRRTSIRVLIPSSNPMDSLTKLLNRARNDEEIFKNRLF